MSREIYLIGVAAGLFVLSGTFLARLLQRRSDTDYLVGVAFNIGLGLSLWPVLFLWTSMLGLRWTAASARIVALVLAGAGLVTLLAVPRTRWKQRYAHLRRRAPWLALFGFLLVLTAVTRWLHVRDLVLPNWVDPVHHIMIVRLVLEHGAVPQGYEPYFETSRPLYHWGYHVLVAWPAWVLGIDDPFRIADLMLQLGQLLNVVVAFMLYAAGRVMFQSRRAGLLVATLGMLVSWFPAYYVSWGRYTHLTGLLVLVPFCIGLWRLHTRPYWGNWIATVLLGTGLFLIHVRIAFLGVLFACVLAAVLLVRRQWRTLGWWISGGVAVGLLAAPWLRVLVASRQFQSMAALPTDSTITWWNGYNTIPWHLVWIPNNRELFALATGGISGLAGWGGAEGWLRAVSGLGFLLVVGVVFWSRTRSTPSSLGISPWRPLALLVAWCGLMAAVLNLHRIGLPPVTFIHTASGVITLFIPLSLAGGGLLAWVSGLLVPRRQALVATALLVIGIGIWGARSMQDVVNPTTVLAQPADVRALRWIRANTPDDATFAVNVWPWLGETYAGSDGGYWIEVLTDRESILPSALYTTSAPPDTIRRVDTLLDDWHGTESLDDPATYNRLRAAGVTHVYVGPRGGHLDPDRLRDSPYTRLVYEHDGVYIFQLVATNEE